MSNRIFVLSLVWLTMMVRPSAAGEPSRRTDEGSQPKALVPTDKATSQVEVSAQEAIQIAVDAIDQLESADDEQTRRALLEKMRQSIEAVERSSPDDPWLYYLHGRVYALTGRGVDAVNLLQRFVETRAGRNEWRAHRVLGDLFVGQYPRLARASYEVAARLKRDEPTVLIGLSKCAFALGDIDEAVQFARSAADADGHKDIRYGRHVASMLMAQQSWAEAQRVAEKDLATARRAADARPEARASLETLDAQYRLLVDILKRRAEATPGAVNVYLDLSKYIRLQADNAVRLSRHDVLRVLQLGVDNTLPDAPAELLERYAIALAEIGRRDEAIAQFEAILARDETNTVATEWLIRLRSGGAPKDPQPQTQP